MLKPPENGTKPSTLRSRSYYMTNSSSRASSPSSPRGSLSDDPFDMSSNGSPTGPRMVDAGKAGAVEDVETSATAQAHIDRGGTS